jgi:arabinofuranosyltransferase
MASMSWPSRACVLVAFLVCAAALFVHARTYMPFFIDDSFISLRYSSRLLNGDGLTWTDGERVEGYSNLLWVLATSAVGLVVEDLVFAARVLGVGSTWLALSALFFVSLRRQSSVVVSSAFALISGLCLAATGPVAAWSLGGLEQPLLIALLAWGVALGDALCDDSVTPTWQDVWPSSTCFGLACLVRPDAPLFTAAAALACLLSRGISRTSVRTAAYLVSLPLAVVAGLLAFRKLYYDALVPNTYHAKGAFSWERVQAGYDYVETSFLPLAPLWAVLLLGTLVFLVSPGARRRLALSLVPCVVWTAYVVRIGGDICPQRRHLVVTFMLSAFVLLELLHFAWSRAGRLRALVPIAGAAVLALLPYKQKGDPQRERALADTWHWSGQPVGIFLRTAFAAERPLLAVDSAGALPYYYEFPCLDMLGLNDRYIAEHPPKGIGKGYVGHELGDGRYVLSRKPDLIAFWTPYGHDRPQWRSGHEMVRTAEFRKLYQLVTFETPDASRTRTRLFVRRKDGRIGLSRTDSEVRVPGFLLEGPQAVARMDAKHRLFVHVPKGSSVHLDDLPLDKGAWRVEVDGDGAVEVLVRDRAALVPVADGILHVESRRGVRIELRARENVEDVVVREVVFTRDTRS